MTHPHGPDWFLLVSGGMDSVVAGHVALRAIRARYQKEPVMVYLDTRIGLPENRLYVEQLADDWGLQLWTLRTHEKHEEFVAENGNPGPSEHSPGIYSRLKGRQLDKLAQTSRWPPHLVTGIRRDESPSRADTPARHEQRGAVWHAPIRNWSKLGCARYVAEHDLRRNPHWGDPHPLDCWCGCHGIPEEIVEIEAEGREAFAEFIRSIEDEAPRDSKRAVWGWAGLDPDDAAWADATFDDEQMQLCGPSCASRAIQRLRPDGGDGGASE